MTKHNSEQQPVTPRSRNHQETSLPALTSTSYLSGLFKIIRSVDELEALPSRLVVQRYRTQGNH